MTDRVKDVAAIYREYGVSLYDAIMSVADVSDLDNAELNLLEDELCNGYVYSNALSQTYPKQGEFGPLVLGVK